MHNKKDSLGNRMKVYEGSFKQFLPKRLPVIIRIDGKAFHSFTRGFDKPKDILFHEAMEKTLLKLCQSIEGVKFGYSQSDEISLTLTNDDTLTTQPWFDNNVQIM